MIRCLFFSLIKKMCKNFYLRCKYLRALKDRRVNWILIFRCTRDELVSGEKFYWNFNWRYLDRSLNFKCDSRVIAARSGGK